MNPRNWFQSFMASQTITRSGRHAPKRKSGFRPIVEALEDRTVPTTTISIANASMNEIGNVSPFVASGSGGLSSPKDLVQGSDGNIYVATGANSVLRYNGTTGQFIGTFVTSGSGGLNFPYGMAFGPDGNLYVASRGDGSSTISAILRYNGSTGAFINSFVPNFDFQPNGPAGLNFGADGNLYVVDNTTASVLRFQGPSGTSPGSPLPATGQTGADFVATGSGGLSHPADLTFGSDGSLYVSSQGANPAILKFDGTSGAFINT